MRVDTAVYPVRVQEEFTIYVNCVNFDQASNVEAKCTIVLSFVNDVQLWQNRGTAKSILLFVH